MGWFKQLFERKESVSEKVNAITRMLATLKEAQGRVLAQVMLTKTERQKAAALEAKLDEARHYLHMLEGDFRKRNQEQVEVHIQQAQKIVGEYQKESTLKGMEPLKDNVSLILTKMKELEHAVIIGQV